MTDIEEEVLSLIRKGRDNAIRSNVIAGVVGCAERVVRKAIRELITQGYCILSATDSPPGYFIAADWEEVMDYAKALRKRGIEDLRRRRDILQAAPSKVPPKQLELIGK
ncbi:hypothetical protein LCGC14_2437410 [marine sediment metagenome]|uniref:Helix-turn-helix type 11 domain-containing protein n=1 Tax=marine sediment metagenome TaxID=412755 RepID=A0A0F9BK28_9ZZZZ